jgi:hypothetical protein
MKVGGPLTLAYSVQSFQHPYLLYHLTLCGAVERPSATALATLMICLVICYYVGRRR